MKVSQFFAPQAWVQGEWKKDVLLVVDQNGNWLSISPGATVEQQQGATRLAGPVLPGLINAHSHAFQRAIAGLTERQSRGAKSSDDFWSWRDRMYAAANRITPDQLEVIACQLYAELLAGGYTQVCEFHYLHNDIDGASYANPVEMSLALVRAAQRTGIGLTLLPTLYMRSGFQATGLREDQRRFSSTPDSVMKVLEKLRLQAKDYSRTNVGVAVHSLRAVSPAALQDIALAAKQLDLPMHIHIAEQTQEVNDCVAHIGERPIEWLLNHLEVDRRWNLVHATHTTPAELHLVKETGAAIVICPATEANLGDGVFDLTGYAGVRGRWSIGSDSHITRSWPEELRLLEYSQRLSLRQRNISARVLENESTAASLFEAALVGGQSATGQLQGGLLPGHRADFLVVDLSSPPLLGVPPDYILDALVFSSPNTLFDKVFVGGKCAISQGQKQKLTGAFSQVMRTLWR